MSSNEKLDKKELQKQKAIRKNDERLVIRIEQALDKSQYPRTGKDKLEESQFRNLLLVAQNTDSPEVIKNFLNYQVGRGEKWGRGKDSLASNLKDDIDKELKKLAGDIAKECKNNDPNFITSIQIELIRRYLGYGFRHLTYKLKGDV